MQNEATVDEISYRRQQRYLTLVTDHRRRRIVWGAEGRDSTTAGRFFAALGAKRRQRIAAISLDMGPGYAKSARTHAPQATIAIDPFHVAKAGSEALDEVRRASRNQLRELGDHDAARRFKGARWALLKRPENLTDKQASTLARLRAAGGEARRAHTPSTNAARHLRPRPDAQPRRGAARALLLARQPQPAQALCQARRHGSASTATGSSPRSASASTTPAPKRSTTRSA